MRIKFTEEVWKEGEMYVSHAPELDIAACGESLEQAKKNLEEVISINFEEMRKLGTLDKYLADAGFQRLPGDDEVIQVKKQLLVFEPRELAV